jgi:hypothetical protein
MGIVGVAEANPVSIFPIHSKPYGHTYGEWSAKWWQWFLSIPKSQNPAFDLVGGKAGTNQDHLSPFFLCQTYENTIVLANRAVSIPANRPIFMPIINWISIEHSDGQTDEELLAVAHEKMNVVMDLEVMINGIPISRPLKDFRAVSPFFTLELPVENIIGLPPGKKRAVSDGFWLFIQPRDKRIEIASFASCSSGSTKIAVVYTISFA